MTNKLNLEEMGLVAIDKFEQEQIDGGLISIISSIPGIARAVVSAVAGTITGLRDGFIKGFNSID